MSKKIKFLIILGIAFLFILGIPEYIFLSLNQAQAANNMVQGLIFYEKTGMLHFKFNVQTSFTSSSEKAFLFNSTSGAGYVEVFLMDNYANPLTNTDYINPSPEGGTCDPVTHRCVLDFKAGVTYDINLDYTRFEYGGTTWRWTYSKYVVEFGVPTTSHYIYIPIQFTGYIDTELYYFTEIPTLTITYPFDEAEISGNFNITGTITQPSPYEYNQLMTYAYLYNPLGPYDEIGVFTIPLLATSTQQFSQPIIGLPISNPNNIILINELQYLNPETETITKTYRQGSGTEFPWQIRMTTFAEGEAPEYPFDPPIWPNYFDIYRPTASSDGYYRLTTPTSTIEFVYNFPETYKVRITQDEAEKLATSTFATVDPDGNLRFTVANFDASTSTIKWVEANVYNASDNLIITALFPIIGLEAGAQENIGIWGQIESFIKGLLTKFFFPSTAVIDKFQTTIPNIVKSKIPISYFYEIKGIIEGANIATSTTPFPSVEVDLGGQMVDIKLIDFSYLEEQGYMATLKNLMRIFLWGMFFMYLYALGTAGPKQLQMKF